MVSSERRRRMRMDGHVAVLGDRNILADPTGDYWGVPKRGEIGWAWKENGDICAYLQLNTGARVKVIVPADRARRAIEAAMRELRPSAPDPEPELNFRGLRKLRRATKGVGKKLTPKPARQIARRAQRQLEPIVRQAAKQAGRAGRAGVKVASSPAFGAAMGALAVAPPLTAVGGAGLAAYAAANKAKHVLNAADALVKGARPLGRAGAAAARNPRGALQSASNMVRNARRVAQQAATDRHARLLTAALKSVG